MPEQLAARKELVVIKASPKIKHKHEWNQKLTWWRFYGRLMREVFHPSWGWTDSIATALGIIGPLFTHFFPKLEAQMTPLVWEIPVGIFSALVVVRLLIAPFWLYKDRQAFADHREIVLRCEIADKEQSLVEVQQKLKEAFSGPQFRGFFYQIQIFPRTGLGEPELLQQLTDIANTRRGLPKATVTFDCDVFVEVCFRNAAPVRGSIIAFQMSAELGNERKSLELERSLQGYELEQEESYLEGTAHMPSKRTTRKLLPDFVANCVNGLPIEQGRGLEGWLRFVLKDIPGQQYLDRKPKFVFTIVDAAGEEHPITEIISGIARPGKIVWYLEGNF